MRVATFNVLHGLSPDDGRVDVARFADAVASLDADVLALQEVDRHQPRSGGVDLAAVAAEAMGAVDHRFAAALEGAVDGVWREPVDRGRPRGPAYGVALLSRIPVHAWSVLRLPTVSVPAPMWFRGDRLPTLVREEPRVALAARLDRPGAPMTVVTTHLSFVPWWNGHQLRTLVRSLRHRRPLLVLGDLNMQPARARRVSGLTALVEATTFPVDDPCEQIDHVLGDGVVVVSGGGASRLPLSDHRALVVDLA